MVRGLSFSFFLSSTSHSLESGSLAHPEMRHLALRFYREPSFGIFILFLSFYLSTIVVDVCDTPSSLFSSLSLFLF